MFKTENSYGLENLNEVWDRVTASMQETPGKTPFDDKAVITELIAAETEMLAECRRIMQKSRNRDARNACANMIAGKQTHIKILQKQYFILTGDSFTPEAASGNMTSMLSELRRCYISSEKIADIYEKAALYSEKTRLRIMYRQLADSEKSYSDILEKLIERAI